MQVKYFYLDCGLVGCNTCNLVSDYKCFGGMYCLFLGWVQCVPPEPWKPLTPRPRVITHRPQSELLVL